jgi:hypothetical protein
VFWTLLNLGAGLFRLVSVGIFAALIRHRWFAYPATALALAVAIHVTDVQPGLIRGARSLALTLFSWLLPMLSVILLGFIGILPFISLLPLWKTHFATGLLIMAAGAVIFLINCCYQDGAAEQVTSRIRRFAATLGAIELLPLAGLAAWGLALRVAQYGWTAERIFAASVVGVACCYAIGYASATISSRGWLRRVETTNVVTAWVVLALVLALFSPLADPARLMVADQVARLKSGAVRPERFDFEALKFDGARWGAAALDELSRIGGDNPDAAEIRTAAARALALAGRGAQKRPDPPPLTAETVTGRFDVYPAGRVLPQTFLDAGLRRLPGIGAPVCFQAYDEKCLAFFVTLRPREPEALLVFRNVAPAVSQVFEQDQAGQWRNSGLLVGPTFCTSVRRGLEKGDIATPPHEWPDVVVGGHRLIIAPPTGPC